MFAKSAFPLTLPPAELDAHLERGWFRMAQTIFTTSFLNFTNTFYSAVWLRIDLARFESSARQERVSKQNSKFRAEIKPATIDPIRELLYAKYRQSLTFEASSSLHQLMYGSAVHNIYNTQEVNMYEGDMLIACGYFDVGEKAAAGITSFYNPDYKKYSLGKYLIYLKIEYCKRTNLQYFYPGYFVPGYPFFDYKLELSNGALEYLDLETSRWRPMEEFNSALTPLRVMIQALSELQGKLSTLKVESQFLKYEYFDANILINTEQNTFFDFPVFVSYQPAVDTVFSIVIFDIRDSKYHLLLCSGLQLSSSDNANGIFSSHLLKLESDLFSTPSVDEIAILLATETRLEPRRLY
jgi:arginyl-tRNA--protein-N-Asp/Glu arginylyltransferase